MTVYVDTRIIESPIEGGLASRSGCILSPQSREMLRTSAAPMPMLEAAADWPERIDPRGWLRIENQGSQGSCQGHSITTCAEGLYYLETGGEIHFSRQFAYVASQKKNNIRGDRGSTVSGGVKVLEEGLPLELLWQYTGRYVTSPPEGWGPCEENRKNYRGKSHVEIKVYDDALAFLASRKGWLHTGFSWGSIIDQQAARDGIIKRWSASGGGGHSVAFVGYNPEGVAWDKDSEPLLIQANSWGNWGKKGYAYWTREAFNAMCAHQWSEVVGVFAMELGPGAVLPDVL